jgi:hypothetical protein
MCRCFPRIPSEWASNVVEGAASSSEGTEAGDRIESMKEKFNTVAEQWSR